jgi:nucleoside-diphosphate-sugar epimerase
MRIFVGGASGAIGQPLIAELLRRGHTVTGMARSEAGAARVARLGAPVAVVSALDRPALERAVRQSEEGRKMGGEDAVYYGTKLRGATNAKAKRILAFAPRRLPRLAQRGEEV